MNIRKKDLRIETMRGTGPGGQHRNKTDSACRITHLPSGISAYADERSQRHSKRAAMKMLEQRLRDAYAQKRAAAKKARRNWSIHNMPRVRTYDYKAGLVYDHRTNKTATIKDVLSKGRIDLLR